MRFLKVLVPSSHKSKRLHTYVGNLPFFTYPLTGMIATRPPPTAKAFAVAVLECDAQKDAHVL